MNSETNLGTEVDGAVRRIETAYDTLGRLQLVTSYDADTGGNVVNQVKRSYDPFGQLQEDHQAHDSAVGSGTPLVSYRYENGAGNTARLEEIIYPDGRTIELGYGTADGAGDWLSRVETVKDVSTSSPWNIASYAYLGADTSVTSAYPEPGVELTYKQESGTGPAGDPYAGLDAFGRIIDHRWSKNGTDIERLKYGYNLAGLRQWRLDTIAHAQNKNQDNYYSYDGLGQVTARDQGQLMDDRTGIDGFPGREEDWVYDPAGNWRLYQRRANNALTLNQFRTHNKVNEIVTYDASGIPVVFNPAGNMTRIPRALIGLDYYEATWDAWNRLVRVKTTGSGPYGSGSYSGAGIEVTYAYDGLWRRTTKNAHTVPTHFYYNADWKCVEERQGASTTPSQQFVFGARGRNDLVFRDRFGTLAGRHYALCDNMGSKVAITSAPGIVVERYAFTAFGDLESVMAPDYTPRTSSLFNWETLFHGEVRDSETGFYNYGFRYLAPMLGRWLSCDPLGDEAFRQQYGEDKTVVERRRMAQIALAPAYLFAENNPVDNDDRLGLDIYLTEGNADVHPWKFANRALHQEICVDEWVATSEPDATCCKGNDGIWYRKAGQRYCVSFAINISSYGDPIGFRRAGRDWLDRRTTLPVMPGWTFGVVYETGDQGLKDVDILKTTCLEDLEFKEKLQGMVGKRDKYEIDCHSCRTFSQMMFDEAKGSYAGP